MWNSGVDYQQANGWYRPKPVVGSFATLDPAFAGTGQVLSNGNLTVTGTANGTSRTTTSHTAGKYYFEATLGATINDSIIGVGDSSQPSTTYITAFNDAGGVGGAAFGGGGWQGGAFTTGTLTADGLVATHVVAFAIDLTNRTVWEKDITSGGNWNASGTANPATNTNGAVMGSPLATGAIYVMVSCTNSSDSVTFNFGASGYAGTPPSGFGNW